MDAKQACDLLSVNRNCSLDKLDQAVEKLSIEAENNTKLSLSQKQERQAQLKYAHRSLQSEKQQASVEKAQTQQQKQPQSVQCQPPLELLIELTLEEIYAGGPKQVRIHRRREELFEKLSGKLSGFTTTGIHQDTRGAQA